MISFFHISPFLNALSAVCSVSCAVLCIPRKLKQGTECSWGPESTQTDRWREGIVGSRNGRLKAEMWGLDGRVSGLMPKSADQLTFIMAFGLQSFSTTYLHGFLPYFLQVLTPRSLARETCSGHCHISTTATLAFNNPLPHLIFSLIF